MKREKLPPHPGILLELYAYLVDVSIDFRDTVCSECAYSLPTFYRKMKCLVGEISNAESEKIYECFLIALKRAKQLAEKYEQNNMSENSQCQE